MKKVAYFVVGLLIVSSLAAISLGQKAGVQNARIERVTNVNKEFLSPNVITTEIQQTKYVELSVDGANGYLTTAGQPILPLSRTNLNLPFGTKIVDISCETGEIHTMKLSYKITPNPKPVITGMEDTKAEYEMDQATYESAELFPSNWYDFTTGGGLDENSEHKTFLILRDYPVRYSPETDTIYYTDSIKLTITYEEPTISPFPETSTYDLVIITPSEFTSILDRLVTHKNKYQIKTTMKTLSDIYSEYSGVDKPEQIKYFIKDAIETWDIKYVMLVGGMTSLISGQSRDDRNKGVNDWWLPVRYTNLREMGSTYDPGFISDLYYADIYWGDGSFSNWDNDRHGESDGYFAAWATFSKPPMAKDYIDFYPDVYVGRIACRNTGEVEDVVTKIIDYERLKHKTNWYENMIVIGGDSHEDSEEILEGEVACDYILDTYMTEWDPVKLYSSNKDVDTQHIPSPTNIKREVTAGTGFLLFEGHGHPGSWNTHWPGIFNWEDTPGGIKITDFYALKNEKKLPICVIGGCHNSQFNVTLMATTLQEPFMWTHGMPVSECFAWHLVRLSQGGTIASFGNTGLGYGRVGEHGDVDGDGINQPDTLEALGGYQIRLFFQTIDEGKDILGEVWGGATKKYLDTFPGMDDQTDAKTVEQWPCLGDPSLKIGGYQTDDSAKIRSLENFPLIARLLNLPIVQKLINLL
jgi:hypothetical protein